MALLDAQAPHRIGLGDRPVFQAGRPRDAAQHAVDEARAATVGGAVRLLDRLVDHRVRGHAVEEQELVDAEPQWRVQAGLDAVEAAVGGLADDVVETAEPGGADATAAESRESVE